MRPGRPCDTSAGDAPARSPRVPREGIRARLVVLTAVGVLLVSCSSGSSSPRGAPHGQASGAHSSTTTGHTSAPSAPSSTSSTSSTAAPSTTASWTTYGGGFSRTSLDSTDPARSAAPVEAWRSHSLDGTVYGEPLVFGGAVYVGTENDTVYGFSSSDGAPLWPALHLATPASASSLPCGDITPVVGITSTMVIDPASGVLFAAGATSSGAGVRHYLFAIEASTGKLLWSRDLDQSWDAVAQLQRVGLALSDGHVVVGFGGNYGDCGDYNGWVLAVPESGAGQILSYRVPTAREGAIWAPAGITVDGSGDVYVATGNGSASAGQQFDHGDAVIELSPQLDELGYFAPSSWAQDNADDLDLGSTAPVLLGDGRVFEIGKEATGYLLDASSLGGIGGQLASISVCSSKGGSAYEAPYLYVVCDSSGRVVQVQVGPGDTLHQGWTWSSPTGGAGSPTIAGGVLWSIDLASSILYGVRLSDGSTQYRVPLDVGQLVHFEATSAAGGMLFVAGPGGVEAFK